MFIHSQDTCNRHVEGCINCPQFHLLGEVWCYQFAKFRMLTRSVTSLRTCRLSGEKSGRVTLRESVLQSVDPNWVATSKFNGRGLFWTLPTGLPILAIRLSAILCSMVRVATLEIDGKWILWKFYIIFKCFIQIKFLFNFYLSVYLFHCGF